VALNRNQATRNNVSTIAQVNHRSRLACAILFLIAPQLSESSRATASRSLKLTAVTLPPLPATSSQPRPLQPQVQQRNRGQTTQLRAFARSLSRQALVGLVSSFLIFLLTNY
jgi:hypothetical protein